jgi:RNA polymerase-binding transcription factor DksA
MTSFIASPHPTPEAPMADIEPLRRMLTEQLDTQRAQLTELAATIDELTGQLDSDSILERELAEHAHQRAVETIAEIQQAIGRMDAGTYGICERCGGGIALARLEVIPFTRHCVACPAPTPPLIG